MRPLIALQETLSIPQVPSPKKATTYPGSDESDSKHNRKHSNL